MGERVGRAVKSCEGVVRDGWMIGLKDGWVKGWLS